MKGLGFDVERPTHAGGTLMSDDKIVDRSTTKTYDLVSSSSEQGAWMIGDTGTYWYDGQTQLSPRGTPPPAGGGQTSPGGQTGTGDSTPPGRRPPVGAPPPHGGNPNNRPSEGPAVPRNTPAGSTQSAAMYAAAYAAQSRYRQRGSGQGRQTTIGAGFGAGTPRTSPVTILGSR